MSKVEEYPGNAIVMVSDGEVWVIDSDYGTQQTIGKIGRVELAIEYPEEMLGICRIEHVMLYDEDDEELYDDQNVVDNAEYHSEESLIESLATQYGISSDIVETI